MTAADNLTDGAALTQTLECCLGAARDRTGKVASYIPALAQVRPDALGIALARVGSARVAHAGDARTGFSIQSISKLFALVAALQTDRSEVQRRVRRVPTGSRFDALLQFDQPAAPPPNPFVNAGALVVTDILLTRRGDARGAVRDLMRDLAEDQSIDFDPAVAGSELAANHRNAAIAHHLASLDMLTNDPTVVLTHYAWQCSLVADCRALATAGLFLARRGRSAAGASVLDPTTVREVNALLITCGVYNASTEFVARVGLPAKSGVGGGILAIAPGYGTICAWSPRLDEHGTSIAGTAAIEAVVQSCHVPSLS